MVKEKIIKIKRNDFISLICILVIFIIAFLICVGFLDYRSYQNNKLKEEIEGCKNNEVIHHTYLLPDGSIHKTSYYKSNNSYTIDNPFKCGDTYYGEFKSYLNNCWERKK